MKKGTFLVYVKYADYARNLTDEEFGRLMRTVFEYAKTGEEPGEGSLSVQAEMLFSIIKADVDIDTEKYIEKCGKNSVNGKKGGRPKRNKDEEAESDSDGEEKANGFPKTEKNQTVLEKAKKPNGFQKSEKSEKSEKSRYDNDNDNDYDYDYEGVGDNDNDNGEERRRLRPALSEYEKLIGPLTPRVAEVLSAYDFSPDVIIHAIKTAHDNGARNLRYIEAVLEGYVKDGVKSVADVERINSQRKKSGKKPKNKGDCGNYDFDEIERLEFERRMKNRESDTT